MSPCSVLYCIVLHHNNFLLLFGTSRQTKNNSSCYVIRIRHIILQELNSRDQYDSLHGITKSLPLDYGYRQITQPHKPVRLIGKSVYS